MNYKLSRQEHCLAKKIIHNYDDTPYSDLKKYIEITVAGLYDENKRNFILKLYNDFTSWSSRNYHYCNDDTKKEVEYWLMGRAITKEMLNIYQEE